MVLSEIIEQVNAGNVAASKNDKFAYFYFLITCMFRSLINILVHFWPISL